MTGPTARRWKTCWSSLLTGESLQRPQKWHRHGLTQGQRNYPWQVKPSHRRQTWGLTVEIPLDKVSLGNLTKLLEAKGQTDTGKPWGSASFPWKSWRTGVAFPWFEELPDSDAVNAYTHFISALCEMSREMAKRVTATEKPVENEKYASAVFCCGWDSSAANIKRSARSC